MQFTNNARQSWDIELKDGRRSLLQQWLQSYFPLPSLPLIAVCLFSDLLLFLSVVLDTSSFFREMLFLTFVLSVRLPSWLEWLSLARKTQQIRDCHPSWHGRQEDRQEEHIESSSGVLMLQAEHLVSWGTWSCQTKRQTHSSSKLRPLIHCGFTVR